MKVGDKVILSDVGMNDYGEEHICNPWFTLGTIEGPSSSVTAGFMFYVKWSNGYLNVYRPEDLKVIKC